MYFSIYVWSKKGAGKVQGHERSKSIQDMETKDATAIFIGGL